MFTEDEFNAAIQELAKLNDLDLETAGKFMARIGDTPTLAEDGRVIVEDENGRELGRVWWR